MQFKMKKGTLINVPEDWIILNEEEAPYCKYAFVVEINRAKNNPPHFLFFSKEKRENLREEIVYELCKKKYKNFQKIYDAQIPLIKNINAPLGYDNIKEHLSSPIVAIFEIFDDKNNPYIKGNTTPPYGVIIQKKI